MKFSNDELKQIKEVLYKVNQYCGNSYACDECPFRIFKNDPDGVDVCMFDDNVEAWEVDKLMF